MHLHSVGCRLTAYACHTCACHGPGTMPGTSRDQKQDKRGLRLIVHGGKGAQISKNEIYTLADADEETKN